MLLPAAAGAQAPTHQALITELDGRVLVTRAEAGAATPARWGTQLFEGDQLRTEADGRVSLLFANNDLVTLGPNRALVVSTSGEAGTGRTVDPALGPEAMNLTVHRSGQGEVAALGGLRSGRADTPIELLAPRQSRVQSPLPVFVWSAADAYEAFEVHVFDETGRIWTGRTDGRELAYPADAPPLAPGRTYTWQVAGETLLDADTSPMAGFSVLSDTEREAVAARETVVRRQFEAAADGSTLLFMLGTFYLREGLFDDAIASFEQLAQRHPEAALPHQILGRLYSEVGLKDHAIHAFEQALALSRR